MRRYGIVANADDEFKPYAAHFATVWSVPLLDVTLEQLALYRAGSYTPPAVVTQLLKYIQASYVPCGALLRARLSYYFFEIYILIHVQTPV